MRVSVVDHAEQGHGLVCALLLLFQLPLRPVHVGLPPLTLHVAARFRSLKCTIDYCVNRRHWCIESDHAYRLARTSMRVSGRDETKFLLAVLALVRLFPGMGPHVRT